MQMTTIQRLVQFQYLRILYDCLLSYSTVTCFEILNVHVQQVKSCIVSQVLTLGVFFLTNTTLSLTRLQKSMHCSTIHWAEVIGCHIHSCVRVCARVCVCMIFYTRFLFIFFFFFVHVLHFLQLLTGFQNRLHSFNQSDWWFDLSV